MPHRAALAVILAACAAFGAALGLAACASAPTPQAVQAKTDAAVQQAAPTVAMACWSLAAADAAFKAFYAGTPKADPAVIADEALAVQAANAICAHPPANTAAAIADILGVYKTVTAKTPAAAPSAAAS
ncbi:MAG TPA: hypothetical protein VMU87_18145 [Stellaceae bacterium]|nr:hypothetical protein [Stellaceae bacterium]